MKFLYVYPDLRGSEGDMLDAGPVSTVASAAELAGWDGMAFTEHPIPGARWLESGGHQTLDPFVALAAAAAVTTRLRLLTYLAVLPYRNPLLLAKAATTLDRVSDGRFVLGVGTGYQKSEFHALGVDFDERNDLFDEALDVLPLHWAGEPFSFQGRHFTAREVIARPRPTADPIPIWIGGNSRLTRRRVAERAQGWIPMMGEPHVSATARTPHLASPADLAAKVAELRELAGGRASDLDIAPPYDDPMLMSPTKEVDRHLEAFNALEAAGATWIVILADTRTTGDTLEFLEAFGATYIGARG